MADNNLETMLHGQVQANLVRALDSAVQAGDIKAAREATNQLADLHLQNSKKAPAQFTNVDIRESLKKKAPWFGVDPRRSAKAVEFGKNMEPTSFKSADEFADKLIKSIAEEFDEEEGDEEEADGPEETEEKKVARKKTDAPSSAMGRAIPRRNSGQWVKLGDAPKEIADTIKASADKFTRNATKEQREKFITTALGTAYAADQKLKGKK